MTRRDFIVFMGVFLIPLTVSVTAKPVPQKTDLKFKNKRKPINPPLLPNDPEGPPKKNILWFERINRWFHSYFGS